MKIRNLRDNIATIRKELRHRRNSQKVEQYPPGHEAGGDVEGQGNEEGAHEGYE